MSPRSKNARVRRNRSVSQARQARAELELLEPRLLLTTLSIGGVTTLEFSDSNNPASPTVATHYVVVTLSDSDRSSAASVELLNGSSGDIDTDPTTGRDDIFTITITGSTPTTVLTILNGTIAAGPPPVTTILPLGSAGPAAYNYGADGLPGGANEDADVLFPAGVGGVRITGAITSDAAMGSLIIDGATMGPITLGGSIGQLVVGYLDGDVTVTGHVGVLSSLAAAGSGDPTATPPNTGLIDISQGADLVNIGGILLDDINLGSGVTPADLTTFPTYSELEDKGLTVEEGATPFTTSNDTPAQAEKVSSISGTLDIFGSIDGRFSVTVGAVTTTYTDFTDCYTFTLTPGRTFNASPSLAGLGTVSLVLLDSTGAWVAVGYGVRLVGGDYSTPINFTPATTGQYTLAVVNTRVDVSRSLAGSLTGYDGGYSVSLVGMQSIALGTLNVSGDMGAANAGVKVNAHAGDVGFVNVTGDVIASNITASLGAIRSVKARNLMGVNISALGDIGIVTATQIVQADITAGGNISEVKTTGDLATSALARSTITADGSIGQILVGGGMYGVDIQVNADGLGSAGYIDLIDIQGDMGRQTDAPAIATGSGGDVRFIRVGGTVWVKDRQTGWTSNRLPVMVTALSPASALTIVDDSGGILSIGLDPLTGSATYRTFPIENGVGVVVLDMSITGNTTLTAAGNAQLSQLTFNPSVATDSLIFSGTGNIDVWLLTQTGTANTITNKTRGSIIAASLGTLTLYLVKSSIGEATLSGATEDLYIPWNIATAPGGGVLHGITSSGDLGTVQAGGAIVDVVCGGRLGILTANADHTTSLGGFDGIKGFIYGASIGVVNVGDGVVPLGLATYADAGIYSAGLIDKVMVSGPTARIQAPIISPVGITLIAATDGAGLTSIIEGGNLADYVLDGPLDTTAGFTGVGGTINKVTISKGAYIDGAYIIASRIDSVTGSGNSGGVINATIWGGGLGVGSVVVDGPGITNTTINSQASVSAIKATGQYGVLDTVGVYITGSLGTLSAPQILNSWITAENQIQTIQVGDLLDQSTISGGGLGTMRVAGDLTYSTLEFAGPMKSVQIGGQVLDTTLACTGPNGNIGSIKVGGYLQMDILVEGQLKSLTNSNGGDMDLNLIVRGPNASLGKLHSAGALHGTLTIDGPAKEISSVGELASAGQLIYVNGDLGKVSTDDAVLGIGANIVVNGTLKQLDSAGGVSGSVRASRGITKFTADGAVTGSVITGGGIGSFQVTDGGVAGDVTAFGDIKNFKVTGDVTGNVTSTAGTIQKLWVANNLAGDVSAGIDVTSATVGGNLSGAIEADGVVKKVAVLGNLTGLVVAGRDVTQLTVGGVVSGTVSAARNIGKVSAGALNAALIASSGDLQSLTVAGDVTDSTVLAGYDLGADLLLNTPDDVLTGGNLVSAMIGGDLNNSVLAAGVGAGAGLLFGTADDLVAGGESSIGKVTVTGIAVDGILASYGIFADTSVGIVKVNGAVLADGFVSGSGVFSVHTVQGTTLVPAGDFDLSAGTPVVITDVDGDQVVVTLTGSGSGKLSTNTGTLTAASITSIQLVGTESSATQLKIVVTPGVGGDGEFTLERLETGDDEGFKSIVMPAVNLNNAVLPALDIDGNVGTLLAGDVANLTSLLLHGTVGSAKFGDVGTSDITSRSIGNFTADSYGGNVVAGLTVRNLNKLSVAGDLGADVTVQAGNDKAAIAVGGDLTGNVTVANDLASLTVGEGVSNVVVRVDGALKKLTVGDDLSNAAVSAGRKLTSATVGSMDASVLAAGLDLPTLKVAGSVVDSNVLAGYDLGSDGLPDTGDDVLQSGSLNSVAIGGDMDTSSFTAGVGAGQDNLFGTDDDTALEGFSAIGTLKIKGSLAVPGSAIGIEAASRLGKLTVGTSSIVTWGLLKVGLVANPAGGPRVLQAQHVGTTFVLTMSEAVLSQTVTSTTLTVVGSVSGALTGSIFVDPVTNKIVWDYGVPLPAAAMLDGETYTVTLVGTGPAPVTDRGGLALDGAFNGDFPAGAGVPGTDFVFDYVYPGSP